MGGLTVMLTEAEKATYRAQYAAQRARRTTPEEQHHPCDALGCSPGARVRHHFKYGHDRMVKDCKACGIMAPAWAYGPAGGRYRRRKLLERVGK